VVVGSAFVRLIEANATDEQIEAFARQLRQGMDTGQGWIRNDTGRS